MEASGPKSNLTIKARFRHAREAEIVLHAISPDNKHLPPVLKLKTRREGTWISVSIQSSRPLLSLLYTADDILSKMVLAKKTLNAIERVPRKKQKERCP